LYFQKPIDHCIKFRKFYFCGAGCYISVFVWSYMFLGFAMHALLPHKQTYKKTLRKNYAYVLLLKHPQEI
jgi:hypothetical protein